MVNTFTLLFIISALVLSYTFLVTLKLKHDFYPYLRILLCAAFLSVICHIVIINSENLLLVKIAYNGFYLLINVLLFSLLEFTRLYTHFNNHLKWPAKILHALLIIDAVSLGANFFFNHEYILLPSVYSFGTETIMVYKIKMYPLFHLHLTLSYIYLALTFMMLIIRIIKTPKLYRTAYIHILISLLILIAGDAFWLFTVFPIDFSIIFYAFTAALIAAYSGRITPQQILYRQLTEVALNMNDGVRVFDIDGECIFSNQAMQNIITKYKNLGLNPEGPFDTLKKGDSYHKLKNLPDRDFDEDVQKNGRIYSFHISTHCLKDERQNFLGAFFIIHDKTREVEKITRELYLATHDPLTNLLNKAGFCEQVKAQLTEAPDENYLMLCSDIDNFKMINDNFGREAGDTLLIRIAEKLREHTKETEVYGRINNDRFAILIKKADFDESIFMKYVNQINFLKEDLLYPIIFHFGIYEIENIDMSVPMMLDRAYIAIETIKGNLQNHFSYYNAALRDNLMQEQHLVGEFPIALTTSQFKMFLQPQVKTDGTVRGAEALVRWIHPKRGILPPHEFIPIFEQKGLITQLDLFIWEQAAAKLSEWKKLGLEDYYISVNISPKDFLHVNIYKTFVDLVKKYDIEPKNLKLEITESAIMLNLDIQLELINNLKKFGFQVEMDDFGSGYSSLNMLKDIPFDILKIDMEFLRSKGNLERTYAILSSIIQLSKNLNMPVITEGVETEEQVKMLKKMGTDYYQGFYFDKPMPIDEFEAKYIRK
ncbi:MAG: EAL domain-containing protein [Treponema sp.]|nr:EAL domain-containing protein [Treponema sp.]